MHDNFLDRSISLEYPPSFLIAKVIDHIVLVRSRALFDSKFACL
jgi:hypothetical protein